MYVILKCNRYDINIRYLDWNNIVFKIENKSDLINVYCVDFLCRS